MAGTKPRCRGRVTLSSKNVAGLESCLFPNKVEADQLTAASEGHCALTRERIVSSEVLLRNMTEKLLCPVCSSFSIEPIMRDAEFTARVEDTAHLLRGLTAFLCFQGHVFLVLSNHADAVEDHGSMLPKKLALQQR